MPPSDSDRREAEQDGQIVVASKGPDGEGGERGCKEEQVSCCRRVEMTPTQGEAAEMREVSEFPQTARLSPTRTCRINLKCL